MSLANATSKRSELKSSYELLFRSQHVLHMTLNMFREVGAITTRNQIQAKLLNR
jgi:hypothetical protein